MTVTSRAWSVVIPTYNRRALLLEAVASALPLRAHVDAEIVVVDDGSRDGSDVALRAAFPQQIQDGMLRIVTNPTNLGVTGAKNAGVRHAVGEWVVFLDSDDLLRPDLMPAMVEDVRGAGDAPVVFFRCVDARGVLIGAAADRPRRLSTRDIVADWSWGECLPVVRRAASLRFPYDVDLKGVEGIAYNRMCRALGPALLSPVAVRTYREDVADRLCAKAGLDARACELARGHLRILREFWRELGVLGVARTLSRAAYHALKCWDQRLRARVRRGRSQPSLAQ